MQQSFFIIGLVLLIIGLVVSLKQKVRLGFLWFCMGGMSIAAAYLSLPKSLPSSNKEALLRIVGSKTIGSELMPKLVKQFLAFSQYRVFAREENIGKIVYLARKEHNNEVLRIEISAIGSSKGFEALSQNTGEIAMASNDMPDATKIALGKRYQASRNEHLLAYDALRIIAHPALKNRLIHLDSSHIANILQGNILNWSELLPNFKGPIHLYMRDENSGTKQFLQHYFASDTLASKASIEQFDYFEKIAAKVQNDSFALGFVDYALDSVLLNTVYTVGILTAAQTTSYPDQEHIRNHSYPLSRPLFLYTNASSENNRIVKDFLQFCKGEEAIEIIQQEGFLPLP